jgi:hypothetical protein
MASRPQLSPKPAYPSDMRTPRKDLPKSTVSNISEDDSRPHVNGKWPVPAEISADLDDVPIEPRFQAIFSNLVKIDHDYLKKILEDKDEEFGSRLLTQIERVIAVETLRTQRANIRNRELKQEIKRCEVELKKQKNMQDSDFNELKEISRHREELTKYEHEKSVLDKNICDTKKKINDINLEIQTLLGKIEANATFFNDLPKESKDLLIREIQDNKVLLDFIKTKSFLRKFVS